MKKKIVFGLLSILVISVAIGFSAYLISAKPAPDMDNKMINMMYVKAEKVNITTTESDMVYRGRMTAFDNVSLAAEVTGRIMQGDVRFKAGESFKKGEVIINIYDEDIRASLKSGKSSLLQTVSKILPDIRVDYSEQYEKWMSFFLDIDPEKSLPELPDITSDKERVFMASNNVLTSYYNLEQQEINLKRYTIKAPFSGYFKTVNKEIGAVASPGAELATIIRSDKLEIIVPVFPDDLKWIGKGDQVKITDNYGRLQTATVSRISGFVDETTQSVNVYLTYYPNGQGSLLEGEYVDVSFKGVEVSGFAMPREAIIENSYVYELTDNQLQKQQITIERQLDDEVIISGLDPDIVIVTESLASINPTVKYMAR